MTTNQSHLNTQIGFDTRKHSLLQIDIEKLLTSNVLYDLYFILNVNKSALIKHVKN